jgi:prepilin-type N-terminal cleavage/methylation domain-containing protein
MEKNMGLFIFRKASKGFTLTEVMISVFILSIAILAIFGSVLIGKYNTTKSQYVVNASSVGKNQMEMIKSLGYFNATSPDYLKYDVTSVRNNPHLAMGGTFNRSNLFSLDTSFDVEATYQDNSSFGTSRVLRTFTVNVYLHPAIAADTTKAPFVDPLVTYVTYVTVGGN